MPAAVKPRSADKPAVQPSAQRVHHPGAPPLRAPTVRAGSGAGGGNDGSVEPKPAASARPTPPAHPQREHSQRLAAVEPAPVSSCSWRELSARDEEMELSDLRRHVALPPNWQPPPRVHAPHPSPPAHEQAVEQAGARPVSVDAANAAHAAEAADAAEAALQLKAARAQRAQKAPTTAVGAEVVARAQPLEPAAVLPSAAKSQLKPHAPPAPLEAPLLEPRDVTSGGGPAAWSMEEYALQDALEDARAGGGTPADGSVSTVGADDAHDEPCDAAEQEIGAIAGVADTALARARAAAAARPSTAPLQSYDTRGAGGEVRLASRRAHARMSHPALPVSAPLWDSHTAVALAAVAALKCRQEEKRLRARAGREQAAEGAAAAAAAAQHAQALPSRAAAAPPLNAHSPSPNSQSAAPPVVAPAPAPPPVAAAPAATAPLAAIAPPIAHPQIVIAPTSAVGNASAARAKLSALRRSRDNAPQSVVAPTAALIPVPSAPPPPPMVPMASSPPTRGFSRVSDCTPLMASVAWPSGQLAAAAATSSAAAVPPPIVPPASVSPARPGSGSGSRSEALARLRRSAGTGALAQQLHPASAPVPSLPPSLPSPPASISGQALCRSATEVEMVFRLGALATERDVADAAAAARRLRAMLAAVASTARSVATEPQHVFAYLVRHMHALTPTSSFASISASWSGPSGMAVSPIRAAQAAPPSWAAADAALGGRAAEYGAAVAELRRLVRIKVQDNNDLALATRCVADACAFFDALHAHAQLEGKPPAAALAELRML